MYQSQHSLHEHWNRIHVNEDRNSVMGQVQAPDRSARGSKREMETKRRARMKRMTNRVGIVSHETSYILLCRDENLSLRLFDC